MIRTSRIILLTVFLAVASCGRGNPSSQADASDLARKPLPTRSFPRVEQPAMMAGNSPMEATFYAVEHFWDNYFRDVSRFRTDSLHVGGVGRKELEQAFGSYATLLWSVSPETAAASTSRLYDLLAASRNVPVAEAFVEWMSHYLYDPNSPVRCEDFYLPFVEKLAEGDLLPEEQRMSYGFQARMCALNRMGTPAADFPFTDIRGRVRTLYSIDAEYLLLIFGNPDCGACKDLVRDMEADSDVTALITSGRLKVVDIFIDREVDAWKARSADYPRAWINGYDHKFQIRDDLLYHVRAIPSMYLLDRDKKVLLKDADAGLLLSCLAQLAGYDSTDYL